MWLYMIAAVLLVLGLVGAVLGGGIFTILVLPVGVIVLIGAFVIAMWSRATTSDKAEKSTPVSEPPPLPHSDRPQPGASGTSSPDELVDARRQA